MNKLIICSECKYSSGSDSSPKYFCEQFVNDLEDAVNNGCTFGKKRITNADKLKEVFGHSDPLLFNDIEETDRITLVKGWLQRTYEEPEDDRTEENK